MYRAKARVALTSAANSRSFRRLDDLIKAGGTLQADGRVELAGEMFWPLIESKAIHQFDPCYGTYADVTADDLRRGHPRAVTDDERRRQQLPQPRFWAEEAVVDELFRSWGWSAPWIIGIRDVTNPENERTAIACILPRVGLIQPLNGVVTHSVTDALWITAALNTFALDFVARQKISARHLNATIFAQLPVPELGLSGGLLDAHILASSFELSYTLGSLRPFAEEFGRSHAPFGWSQERRALLRAELDAAFFCIYGFSEEDVKYVMETFPIVKRRDEARFGHYRTKRLIFDVYRKMAHAIASGVPYEPILDPPPGDPRGAHQSASRSVAVDG